MPGRRAMAQAPSVAEPWEDLPAHLRRNAPPALPEVSEMQVVRHYTRLSQRNFATRFTRDSRLQTFLKTS